MASNPKRIDKSLFSDELKVELEGKRNACDSISKSVLGRYHLLKEA